MHNRPRACALPIGAAAVLAAALLRPLVPRAAGGQTAPAAADTGVAVGAQYDSTHVYVAPSDLDAFVTSIVATFGGQPTKPSVTNILPVTSSTEWQALPSPVGMLSIFAFQ